MYTVLLVPGSAAHKAEDPIHLPAADDPIQDRIDIAEPALTPAKGKLPNVTDLKIVPAVETADAPVQVEEGRDINIESSQGLTVVAPSIRVLLMLRLTPLTLKASDRKGFVWMECTSSGGVKPGNVLNRS